MGSFGFLSGSHRSSLLSPVTKFSQLQTLTFWFVWLLFSSDAQTLFGNNTSRRLREPLSLGPNSRSDRGTFSQTPAPRSLSSCLPPTPLPMPLQTQSRSVSQFSRSLQPHGLEQARPPCPSPTPGIYSNSCLLGL